MAISDLGGIDEEFGFIQKSLPKPDLTISELDGLNLNITVPLIQEQLPTPEHKLPVFVFIHGGAFAIGSNSWPQWDHARIVKLSAEIGQPAIGIGIK
jgi:carboxylesterase type B